MVFSEQFAKDCGPRDNAAIEAFREFLSTLTIQIPKELILINPQLIPHDVFDRTIALNQGYYAFPPVGLLYIAAAARKVIPEIKLKIIDLNYEVLRQVHENSQFSFDVWQKILEEALKDCEAPYIGITYMFGASKPAFLEVVQWIRKRFPDVPVLGGGVQATYDFEELLENNYVDIMFRKEAEHQFELFLKTCLNFDSANVPFGIAFRHKGKTYELGKPDGNLFIDSDIRPFYDLINLGDYHKYGSLAAFSRYNGADKPFATVLSNRGCRARCTFCTVRDFNGFGVRQRPIQHVIDEIKYLVREKGIKQIDWLDDDLLMDPVRTVDLFKGLHAQIPELEWICNNGLIAAAISEEIMDWMVKSGMKAVKLGIESGNDEMLHKIKKPTTKPKLMQRRELFRRYPEVFVSPNFIIGFPKETLGQMLDTYNFANQLEWDWSSYYICQPLKGTEMFSAFQELGDDRTEVENYDKTLNPGRASARGEFGYHFNEGDPVVTGNKIFNLDPTKIPSREQIKEIWFTFNMITNFINNINFTPRGNPEKIVRWLESIAHAYPYDASMCAGLCRGYQMMKNDEKFLFYREKFLSILTESVYWQKRIKDFPELLEYGNITLQEVMSTNDSKNGIEASENRRSK